MKIHYWGTAAAEGIPGIFCTCPRCIEAREKGDRYVRTRSQLMLDDTLLVDFGADTYMHSLKYGADLSRLAHVFVTHAHWDHFYPTEFIMRRKGFASIVSAPLLTIHGSPDLPVLTRAIYETREVSLDDLLATGRIAFDVMLPYESREAEGFTVTALPASHGTAHPYVYIFEKDGKCFFMHNDSGYLKPEVMEWLRMGGKKFDLVSYECTHGADDAAKDGNAKNHLGFPNVLEEKRRLIENGNYKDTTLDVITHFSHNPEEAGYADMLKYAEREGILLAYVGMTVEI
jgi:phosphoribosyl 1,2-cyclic phosphate phosphodiesterase